MLRADNIVCGTSTIGTGTLSLAATPTPPGGIDFDVWARATGIGFANSAAILVSYTIIEYTDSTFATAKSYEKGIGTLTLGGSSGIANATLARTTVQSKGTSLNSQPATPTYAAPTAFSIATAANTLVFIGPSTADVSAWSPYYETTSGDNLGAAPANAMSSAAAQGGNNLVTLVDRYIPFEWRVPMLVKKASMRVQTAYATGSPVSNAYGRLYAFNSAGRPGKLLLDLGLFGSAGTSLNATGNMSTAVHASGFLLLPGDYIFGFICSLSGGAVAPKLLVPGNSGSFINSGRFGTTATQPFYTASATSGTTTPAPDPANVTGYAGSTSVNDLPFFTLAPS